MILAEKWNCLSSIWGRKPSFCGTYEWHNVPKITAQISSPPPSPPPPPPYKWWFGSYVYQFKPTYYIYTNEVLQGVQAAAMTPHSAFYDQLYIDSIFRSVVLISQLFLNLAKYTSDTRHSAGGDRGRLVSVCPAEYIQHESELVSKQETLCRKYLNVRYPDHVNNVYNSI